MMNVDPKSRRAGLLRLPSSGHRTLTGGHFSEYHKAGRKQRVEIPLLLSEDVHTVQAATEPLRYFFPSQGWEDWGIEILEGHYFIAEVLPEEQTLLIERRALDHLPLLSWELFGAFIQGVLHTEFGHYLEDQEVILLSCMAQLSWFVRESEEWQHDILAFVSEQLPAEKSLLALLWRSLPVSRQEALQASSALSHFVCREVDLPSSREDRLEALQQAVMAYLKDVSLLDEAYEPEDRGKALAQFQRAFSICSLLPWEAMCSALPGMLVRFFHEIDSGANSTDRRLGLFRIVIEHGLCSAMLDLDPLAWPRMSVLALDPDRHPKIYQALLQYLELTYERKRGVLWSIQSDDNILAKLALQNQLTEQDDRFFRQATHVQAIWRDILHRNASQEWASQLLFNMLERVVSEIEAEPDLLFAAVIWNRAMWEAAPTPIAPPLQNLRELLWVLSQAPLAVLRRLYPTDEKEQAEAHKRWALIRTHLKRFLHLAPPILSRLCDQLEEEQGRPKTNEQRQHKFDTEADPDIPQQELHGRILPLLSRPDIKRYTHIDLDKTKTLRVLHLDRYLHQSSGLWREHRFFSSFLLFFKTEEDAQEGGWAELALWIDKDLDLGKVVNKSGLSSTIRGLLLEDGIWERTYRYQFLTVEQLMTKLNPNATEWSQLLHLLGNEYAGLLEQRLRELLDFQYYMVREKELGSHALTEHVEHTDELPEGALWRLPIEEYEANKPALAAHIAARVLQSFYRTQLQDDRNWEHAHQALLQWVQGVSSLLQLSPGALTQPKIGASELHHLCADVIEGWADTSGDFYAHHAADPDAWLDDKISLIKRLHRQHWDGAQAFVRFLLEQFKESFRVVQLLMNQRPEGEKKPVFKPIPTSAESAERQKQMVPFLRAANGQLLNPTFLQLFAQIPKPLLQSVLDARPLLFSSLQRVTELLREVDPDGDKTTQLSELLEEVRATKPEAAEEPLPANADKSLDSADPN